MSEGDPDQTTMDPDHASRLQRAHLLSETGRYAEAEHQVRQALAGAPDDAELLVFLAYLCRMQGQPQAGLAAVEAAVAAEPRSAQAHIERAETLLALWRDKQAVEAANEAVRLAPLSERGHRALAAALASTQEYDGARKAAETAVALAPHSVSAMLTLADVLRQSGARSAAYQAVREALRRSPTDAHARWLLALVEADHHRVRRSLRTLRGVARDEPAWSVGMSMLWPIQRVLDLGRRILSAAVLAACLAFAARVWDVGPLAVAARTLAGFAGLVVLCHAARVLLPAGRTPWRCLRLVPRPLHRALLAAAAATCGELALLAAYAATGGLFMAVLALAFVPVLWACGLAVGIGEHIDDPGFHESRRDLSAQLRGLGAELRQWARQTRAELREAWRDDPREPGQRH